MADVRDPGGARQGGQNEDRIPAPPPVLRKYLNYWHNWYNFVVHRGANVAPFIVPPYTADLVTNEVRRAPFPRAISETWSCAVLLTLIIVVHHGAEKGWLFEDDYPAPKWAGRVLGRVLLTLGAAVLSTLGFEIIGSVTAIELLAATARMEHSISVFLIKYFHWGEVDADGEPELDEHNNFIWLIDPTYRRESIREAIQALAIVALDYSATSSLEMVNQLAQLFVEHIIGPALYFFFSIPVDFVPKLLSLMSLPTPGFDNNIRDPRALWFEYGVPIVIQFWLLVLLWLLKILFIAKAERLALRGWRVLDPKMNLIRHLIRATAMHFLAYTAYQLVCGCIVGIRSCLPQDSEYITIVDGPIVPFLGKVMPNGRIFAAGLLFFFHWLLRAASIQGVHLARKFWMPYILWQTSYSTSGADRYWPQFVQALSQDLTLLPLTKRVMSRVVMTAVFGLRSSWPARFHLSAVVEDD